MLRTRSSRRRRAPAWHATTGAATSTEPYDPEVDPDVGPDSLNPRSQGAKDEPQVGDDPTGFDD